MGREIETLNAPITDAVYYDPNAPRRFWPKEMYKTRTEYTAVRSSTDAVCFNAVSEEEAIKFARSFGAYQLEAMRNHKAVMIFHAALQRATGSGQ